MTGQAEDIQWYIARDGKQHGPLTDIEMRTFVAHNYLRTSDLIWRPGMPEWQAAPIVFPTAFQGSQPGAAAAQPSPARPQTALPNARPAPAQREHQHSDFEVTNAVSSDRRLPKRLAIAAAAVALVGGGAFALTNYRAPLMQMVSGSSAGGQKPPVVAAPADENTADDAAATKAPSGPNKDVASASPSTPEELSSPDATAAEASAAASAPAVAAAATSVPPAAVATAATTTSSTTLSEPPSGLGAADVGRQDDIKVRQTKVATIDPQADAPSAPPTVGASPTDLRLQKVEVWELIKREYPDWYASQTAAADKLVADKRPDGDVAMLLAQGLVNLRRQNADKALAASSEKLQKVAEAFLAHLKALRAQSVSACFGFISKGETSPAAVQMMENPETATALNAQADAVFEAISEGAKSPVKHDSAVKSDYDQLIKELSKLGWKEEDLQVFSNPKLLAKREPEQVCKLVQEWFVAHLAVPDKAVRDRLLYETLKPVVSG